MFKEAMTTSHKCRYSGDISPSKMLGTTVAGYQNNAYTKVQAKKRRRSVDRSYKNLQKGLEDSL